MSDIVKSMQLLRSSFDRHAGKDGDPTSLTKKEICDLLKHEGFPLDSGNKAQTDEFFKMLDGDGDGVVNFREFVTFVAALSEICYGK